MIKKIIQVPIDEELLVSLNRVSNKQGRARAELIREACLSYLRQIEEDEMDVIYRKGYAKIPEKGGIGRAQAALTASVLPRGRW
jgi:metal-responsive CopG/Arc/MetJ family transcriptional regulator